MPLTRLFPFQLLIAILLVLTMPAAGTAAPGLLAAAPAAHMQLVTAGGAALLRGIPAPAGLFVRGKVPADANDRILEAMLGIPYRMDGAVNEKGEFTLFADQSRRFTDPGLNCSGFVLQASRYLLKRNFVLDDIRRDRLSDSGPGSSHGEDWDFGWDAIMNISDPFPRFMLLPGGKQMDPLKSTGFSPRGFDIQSDATWKELPARLKPGYLYLVSFSDTGRRKGYGLQHYHVGLIHVSAGGNAWYYHTTGTGSKSNRRDLKSAQGQASFKKAFANKGQKRKMMVIIAVKMP